MTFVIGAILVWRWHCRRLVWRKLMNVPLIDLQDMAMGHRGLSEWERLIAVKVMIWRNSKDKT